MSKTIYQNLLNQAEKLRRHNKQGSYKTRERYFEAYKRFLQFVAEEYHLQKISNICPKHVLAYVRAMQNKNLAASTIKTDLAAIRFWHDQIPSVRYALPSNSELDLKRRRFGGKDRTWSQGEYNRMIALCWKHKRDDYAACVTLGRHAGLRIHEVMRIDTAMARATLQTGMLVIKGKNGRIREVEINEPVRLVFKEYVSLTQPGHKLFVPDNLPTHIAIRELENFINKHRPHVEEPGRQIPLTFHGLRHTYAMEQYLLNREAGQTEKGAKQKVSHSIGHNRLDVTNIYLAGINGGKRGGEDEK